MALDPYTLKSQFPIFRHHPGLVYLDNAATTQKPNAVIETITTFYEKENANIHRGLYALSAKATQRYEAVRAKAAALIHAPSPACIAFTKGTTDAINIVARNVAHTLRPGDRIVATALEHHANLIPWQQACAQNGAHLDIAPIDPQGNLRLEALEALLGKTVRLLVITHISNALGTVNPLKETIAMAHEKNIPVLVDAAQSVGHCPVDVQALGADFLAFSAHKMFGPFGTGVLYAHPKHHEALKPITFGGGHVREVSHQQSSFLPYPHALEAGTPPIDGVIALGAAIDFISTLDLNETFAHEKHLAHTFREGLKALGNIQCVGEPTEGNGIVSFNVGDIHPHDVAGFLAEAQIAVRAGHHCAQPLLDELQVHATVRVSFSIYNTLEDVHHTLDALRDLKKFWS